ncbi:alpha/beta fold hydrolase [Nocardiopsis halotolerans]|uniref:alpha/beta fold hydrolase n=1 Tax=Nocardiopsis halotolerans TaxID=124252 RepID=UPI00034AAFBE|nr:alpha/beta hydrolase [Nocardiopsis halotolerans]
MATQELEDGTIHYVDRGSGPVLVLLPGLGYDHSLWEPQIERWSGDHRVLALDPRGVGGSSRLHVRSGILAAQAADIAVVLDRLGIDRAVVCGVSYGGVLAQRFALDHPERVAALVTVDSFSDTRPRSFAEAVNRVLLELTGWLWLFPRLLRPAISRQYARWPLARRYMEAGLERMRGPETVRIRYALNRVSHTSQLPRFDGPALVVTSDSPWLLPMSRRIADALPRGRLTVIEDSFDPSNLCRPERFDEVLGDFLRETGL